jgi:hypothetical protein
MPGIEFVLAFALLPHEFAYYRDMMDGNWDFVAKAKDATKFKRPEEAICYAESVNFKSSEYVVAVIGA